MVHARVLILLLLVQCGPVGTTPSCAGGQTPEVTRVPPSEGQNAVRDLDFVQAVKRRHDDELMAIPGVVGTSIANDAEGRPLIEVYVDRPTDEFSDAVPTQIEGVTVRLVETGPFTAR